MPEAAPAQSGGRLSPSGGLTAPRFAMLLAVLVAAAFPDVVFGLRTFEAGDFGRFGHPIAHFHREAFWRGEVPLWNPFNDFGLPFLAQWNTLTLYPGSLIYLLLPLSWSLGVFCLLHLWAGGVGMFLLTRRWTGHAPAAAFAGVAYAFSAVALHSLLWPNNSAALGWLPWVVFGWERALVGGGRALLAGAGITALQLLTGAPEIILQTWLLAAVACALQPGSEVRWLARLVGLVALAMALAAVQLLPFLELLHQSHRAAGLAPVEWSMPATGWGNLLLPLFHAHPFPNGVFHQPTQQWIASYYAGIGVLFLALGALLTVRERRVWGLGGLLLAGLWLALGDGAGLFAWLRAVVPFLGGLRYPVKFVVLAVAVLPLLAALGLAHWETRGAAGRTWLLALGGGLLLGVCALAWWGDQFPLYPLPAEDRAALRANAGLRVLFLAVTMGAAGLAVQRPATPRAGLAFAALLVAAWLDGLTHMPVHTVRVDRDLLAPGVAELKPLPRLGEARALVRTSANRALVQLVLPDAGRDYLIARLALFANCNLVEAVPKVDGFFALYPRAQRPVRLLFGAEEIPGPLGDFVGVTQVTRVGSLFQWEPRPGAQPLATAGMRPEFAPDAEVLARLTNFNPRAEVFLPPEARALVPFTNGAPAEAKVLLWTAQRLEVEVRAEAPALLVLAQTDYPSWGATVGGRPAPILRANHCFQAVVVPAGVTRVTLQLADVAFRLGLAVSLGALALTGALWWRWGRVGEVSP
jgi:hypothetical protein